MHWPVSNVVNLESVQVLKTTGMLQFVKRARLACTDMIVSNFQQFGNPDRIFLHMCFSYGYEKWVYESLLAIEWNFTKLLQRNISRSKFYKWFTSLSQLLFSIICSSIFNTVFAKKTIVTRMTIAHATPRETYWCVQLTWSWFQFLPSIY